MSSIGGNIFVREVHNSAMDEDQSAGGALKGHRVFQVPHDGLLRHKLNTFVGGVLATETPVNAETMASRNSPEAAILFGAFFKGPPEAEHRLRFSVKESAILMSTDLTTSESLLKNVHRLHAEGLLHT